MLGNMVHPCREVIYSNTMSTVMDVQTYILILYNYKWILEICGGYVAPRLLSHRESGKDLWALMLQHACLILKCYSLLFYMLQDTLSCLKMLVFDRLGLPPLFWHSAVQSTDTTLPFDTNAYIV